MKAFVSNRGLASRSVNLVLGKTLGPGVTIKDVPIPTIDDHEILVKVRAVALNPIDVKSIDLLSPPNSIQGSDYAGEVLKVGSNVSKIWKIGDRVAGLVHGGIYPDTGAFAEYLKVDAELAWKIPEGISDEDATTYGISASTAMLALSVELGIPVNNQEHVVNAESPAVLIYAASTAVGLFSVQLAKRAGYRIVATASPRSFELVKQYGADAVFDYRSATVSQDIANAFPGLTQAFDCISEGQSTSICAKALGKNGGKIVTLLDQGQSKISDIEHRFLMVFSVFGKPFAWLQPIGPRFEASAPKREALVQFYHDLPATCKSIKAPPIRIQKGGFDGVLEGLEDLRRGRVSGCKLTVPFHLV